MATENSLSQETTDALRALPFGSIIGAPLKACIEAQAMAAQTSWKFIQEVGLQNNPETGEKEIVNVSFLFKKQGQVSQISIPLLTIIPIPYIAVEKVDISFKANIMASNTVQEKEENCFTIRNWRIYSPAKKEKPSVKKPIRIWERVSKT